MGKRLITQARGRGGPRYRAPSFNYAGKISYVPVSPETFQGKITELMHSSGHSSPLVRIRYDALQNKEILLVAPEGMRVGSFVQCGPDAPVASGNTLPLNAMPEGTLVYNIESNPGDGGKFVRASGTFARITNVTPSKITLMLPSKKTREFNPMCRATVGVCAGGGRLEKPLLRAGTAFFKYKAKNKLWPRSAGVKMNAVDHPYGCKRSSRKGRPNVAPKNAPPGRNVGKIRARQTGRKSTRAVEKTTV